MIEVVELSRTFGKLVAVNDVTFEVHAGEVFGLLGPNGAGKTTLIRMLTGVLAPSQGDARVAGLSVARESEKVKGRIGYATQDASVYPYLTVRENLAFRAALYLPKSEVPAAVESSLKRFGLEPIQDRLARALSGGWRQRLSLAQAMVHRPQVVFLDEPTTGLDPLARRAIWDQIYAGAGEGVTALVTTHYMDEAERCHRVGLLYSGRLVEVGTPAEIKAKAKARHRFLAGPPDFDGFSDLEGLVDVWQAGDRKKIILRREAPVPAGLSEIEPTLEDAFISLTKEVAHAS